MHRNGLAAILATKRSAGITPEVKLMILLHAGDKAHKLGDPPRADVGVLSYHNLINMH